jgi:hypothetical protein
VTPLQLVSELIAEKQRARDWAFQESNSMERVVDDPSLSRFERVFTLLTVAAKLKEEAPGNDRTHDPNFLSVGSLSIEPSVSIRPGALEIKPTSVVTVLVPPSVKHPGAPAFVVDDGLDEAVLQNLRELYSILPAHPPEKPADSVRKYVADGRQLVKRHIEGLAARALEYMSGSVAKTTSPVVMRHQRFLCYKQGGRLPPHVDLSRSNADGCTSTHTFILYLSGGAARHFAKKEPSSSVDQPQGSSTDGDMGGVNEISGLSGQFCCDPNTGDPVQVISECTHTHSAIPGEKPPGATGLLERLPGACQGDRPCAADFEAKEEPDQFASSAAADLDDSKQSSDSQGNIQPTQESSPQAPKQKGKKMSAKEARPPKYSPIYVSPRYGRLLVFPHLCPHEGVETGLDAESKLFLRGEILIPKLT